ncbi:hypothetical protein J6590_063251 [Homalodisca vitripennis]|nr:hypothetical protein J6590_063251 [Homalodisca vitripennis]
MALARSWTTGQGHVQARSMTGGYQDFIHSVAKPLDSEKTISGRRQGYPSSLQLSQFYNTNIFSFVPLKAVIIGSGTTTEPYWSCAFFG